MSPTRRNSEIEIRERVLDALDDLFNTLRDIEPADAASKRLLQRARTRVFALEDYLSNP